MRFLAIEPFFFNYQYYPASPEKPLAFDFPKESVPNVRWYPLDKEALTALEALRDQILSYGNRVTIHKIPANVAYPSPISIEAPEPVSADPVPPGLGRLTPAAPEQFSMSDIQKQEKGPIPQSRPSDREPPKR